MTTREAQMAVAGYARSRGAETAYKPMTLDEYEELLAKLGEAG